MFCDWCIQKSTCVARPYTRAAKRGFYVRSCMWICVGMTNTSAEIEHTQSAYTINSQQCYSIVEGLLNLLNSTTLHNWKTYPTALFILNSCETSKLVCAQYASYTVSSLRTLSIRCATSSKESSLATWNQCYRLPCWIAQWYYWRIWEGRCIGFYCSNEIHFCLTEQQWSSFENINWYRNLSSNNHYWLKNRSATSNPRRITISPYSCYFNTRHFLVLPM